MIAAHDHRFGQDERRSGEARTVAVILLTTITMLVEVWAGIAYGSMALLADGLHMASHAAALGVAAIAYIAARRWAGDPRFSFGTGKINALGGFTGAVLLAGFAVFMASESLSRFVNPVSIRFNEAIAVAILGLVVNGVSVAILHQKGSGSPHSHHDHDHNLRAAFFHVLADALTSLLAIVALLAAKFFGATWMDPMMGIVGSILVARWSWGLLRDTSGVLLDRQAPANSVERLRQFLHECGATRVLDLHMWSIGPGLWAAVATVESNESEDDQTFAGALPEDLGVVHLTVEVSRVKSEAEPGADS